jgi:hypothetical protein
MGTIHGITDCNHYLMKICSTCGNEIDRQMSECPYCLTPQEVEKSSPHTRPHRVREIVLKEGQPTVEEAIARLKDEVASAKNASVSVLKVVHGYGSSGKGGAIKTAVLKRLRAWQTKGEISSYMTGEQHFDRGARHNYLLRRYPELKSTWKSDRGNPGITFIEL